MNRKATPLTTCFTGSHLRHATRSRDIPDFGMYRNLSLGWVRVAELLTTVISKNNRTCQFS
jgi:hypothetical protein